MRNLVIPPLFALLAASAFPPDKFQERLQECGTVMEEILDMPDSIPTDLLHKAECVLVMNSRGANALLKSKVKLGADASAAAGPKGRATGAATDASMHAEILTYSRARGLFAGVSLEGASLRPDDDANQEVYGLEISVRDIVLASKGAAPGAANKLVALLQEASPKNLSE